MYMYLLVSWFSFIGHLAQDCFHVAGGKGYDLIEEEGEAFESHEKTPKQKSSKSKKKVECDWAWLLTWTDLFGA